jgi:phenylpyruvate tautomerase PptA (4-oxalocrotonate tautomerase family)
MMPLVKIHLVEGRDRAAVRALADTVHEVVVETLAAPERDRYQIIHEHPRAGLILLDTGLGIERSDGVVLVEIIQQGRDEAQKRALYRRLAEELSERGHARPEDLIVSVSENRRADWSFGFEQAQFLTGEL